MLPVSSTTPGASVHCQISPYVGRKTLFPFRKSIEDHFSCGDRVFLPNGFRISQPTCKTNAINIVTAGIAQRSEQSDSTDFGSSYLFQNEFDGIAHDLSDGCIYNEPQEGSCPIKAINSLQPSGEHLCYVESSVSGNEIFLLRNDLSDVTSGELSSQSTTAGQFKELQHLPDPFQLRTDMASKPSISEALATSNASSNFTSDEPALASDTYDAANSALSQMKENLAGFLSGISDSVDSSINKANNTFQNAFDAIGLSLTNAVKSVTESYETSINGLLSSSGSTGEFADSKLTDITKDLKDTTFKAGILAVDVLRKGIIAAEDSLAKGSSFLFSSYESSKLLLPLEIRDALNSSEKNVVEVLKPVRMAFEQVYIGIEGLEKYLGLDPNDPIVTFVLLLSSSTILVISYQVIKYGGYAGNLSPASTMKLLSEDDSAVLIDIRPEVLRDRDGIPDIRRGARFRYADVTLPEVDGSVKKLLKKGRDVDDALLAAVIKNLKIVQDRSKVIILDANGSHSKNVARSLRKLGLKGSYLVQGGFGSWAKDGLRIKENKAVTALTILNEEAEAIIEDIKPTPLKSFGFGVGLLLGVYALVEWEKSLQLIGLIGLGQTVYRRVASYEDPEDFKQDLRMLLAPVRLGGQVVSWAAGKLESNNIGLPTSPSTTAVQSRVLQAAAKHESQPSDEENPQDASRESATSSTGENLDLSEA